MRANRGDSHAWRAGGLETCTSGSARGAQKPPAARQAGAVLLLYLLLFRAAPIAASMAVAKTGDDRTAPIGRNNVEGGKSQIC